MTPAKFDAWWESGGFKTAEAYTRKFGDAQARKELIGVIYLIARSRLRKYDDSRGDVEAWLRYQCMHAARLYLRGERHRKREYHFNLEFETIDRDSPTPELPDEDLEALCVTIMRQARGDLLTRRERQVLKLLPTGKTDKEIGSLLGVSERTVGTHLQTLFEKLDVHNRMEAVMDGIRRGIIVVG